MRRVLLAVLALAAAPARADEPRPRWDPATTHALLVGVLAWEDPSFAPFPKPGRKDRVLEKALLARGVPRSHVTFLEDEAATLAAVRKELARVAQAAGPGSTLLLYYAGHGGREKGRTYFTPVDTDGNRVAETGWSVDEIGKTLHATWKGSTLLLLADCCHSGALSEVVDAFADRPEVKAVAFPSAMACNLSTGNWTFTESVVAAVEGQDAADEDADGLVTFTEADRFVAREMRFRERQLAEWHRSDAFDPETVLAPVGKRAPREDVDFPPRAYVEAEWKGTWYRAQVLAAKEETRRVHYLGYGSDTDEWLPLERLREPTPLAATKGDEIQVEWKGKWWPAAILDVRDDFALVHYDDYDASWDEWVTRGRMRKRP